MPDEQGRGTSPTPHPVVKPPLLSVEESKALSVEQMGELFTAHINPGQYHYLTLLGFHRIKIERAEGMYYIDQNGRRILDFFGGFGSVGLGHNHPRLLAARTRFQDERRHDIALAFMSQYAAALSYNLAACSPGDLDMVFLGSSGSEAMEAAIKLAERAAGPLRPKIVYAENSFHGKTKGVLGVTDGRLYRADFTLPGNTLRVPFGDISAVERAFRSDPAIGTIVLETIQGGGGIISASPEYWRQLRALCDQYGVLWVADEVQCGYGRTGRFYAFEHYGVVPDVTALAKSLGGGKAAVGAMIARRELYMRAYGTPETALIHASATFGGIGESAATAIEALNVLYDEALIDNAADTGAYLLERLRTLQRRYPRLIKEVRGQGLMVGLVFHDLSYAMPAMMRPVLGRFDERLKGAVSGSVGALLLRDYAVLVAFTEYDRNVIRLEPPLICQREHVDVFIESLDGLLSRGIVAIVKDFMKARRHSMKEGR